MSRLEKFQTVIIFGAMILGLLLGQITFFQNYAGAFVSPFLFVMLFGVFLNIPITEYRKAYANRRFSATAVLLNFVWTPILVWLLGKWLLPDYPLLQIGFLMLMVTPCTDWYLIFTGLAKGNVPLSATILPINLILQVVLLPLYLLIFAGTSGTVDMGELISSIVVMLILPFALAQLTKILLNQWQDDGKREKIFSAFASLQTILLALAIMAMFASKGQSLVANLNVVYQLLAPILLFYLINFVVAQFISRVFLYSYEDTASLTLTIIAKNSPMTLGVAIMAFPNEPIIPLIMIIEPLIELPMMLLITRILLLIRNTKTTALTSS